MNKPENVPIATLAGIATLTEIASELPLPSSSSPGTKDALVFTNQQQAAEANTLVQQPVQNQMQLESLTRLLGSINNAYLDFKNTTHNRPSHFDEQSHLPPILQHVLHNNPVIFQPHFDTYHGSPLKSNAISALAYSPNQRNAFILHHQQQQEQMQQYYNQVANLKHPSPLIQASQFSSSSSSSPMKSPHIQQFFKANVPLHSPQVMYNNMASPMLRSPNLQQQQQLSTQQINQQQQLQKQQLIHRQVEGQQQMSQSQARTLLNQQQPQNNAFQQPGSASIHATSISVKSAEVQHVSPPVDDQFFSPLKTRGQRHSTAGVLPSELSHPDDARKNLILTQSFDAGKQILDEPPVLNLSEPPHNRKSHRKHRKSKERQSTEMALSSNKHIDKTSCVLDHKENNEINRLHQSIKHKHQYKLDEPVINDNSSHVNHVKGMNQILELKVPKLIVRKVKRLEGNDEIETLEVYSPDKEKQICSIRTPVVDHNEYINEFQDGRRTSKRTRSKASSVSSADSIKVKKRKKVRMKPLSSEEEEEGNELYSEGHLTKRFKHNDINDIEGVEINTEVKKFVFLMDKILDRELELEADGVLDINEDAEIPPETLLARPVITSLCSEVAKMKSSGMLNQMPIDQLVRIISVMDRHVQDTAQLAILQEDEEEESKNWYLIQAERIIRSAEAAAVILHITTTPEMPKQVYLEEAIEHIASHCQFHLENTVYPEFDPIYKVTSENKDSAFLPKSKRSRNTGTKNKLTLQVYNKFCDIVSLLGDLIAIENLTDSIILKMSQIGISPFFVEQVSVLQLEALKVARIIFRNYVKHRDLILDDILTSIARLPSSKRSLRSYRLQENISIQMFTALVLQLVQCTVQIPDKIEASDSQEGNLVDKDVLIVKSYEDALRAARNFMSIFLKKCSANSRDENDFRPLFENFLHDLFATANLPEWPAAEVLLTQLGRLFVVTFSNAKLDMSLRSTALDYLSQITTHLRKSALQSHTEGEREKLKLIVEKLLNTKEYDDVPVIEDMEVYDEKLRKALLMYLKSCSDSDPSFKYAREFYLGQWIRDVQIDIEKSMIAPMLSIPGAATQTENDEEEQSKAEISAEKLQVLQEKKDFYHTLIGEKSTSSLRSVQLLNFESSCTVVDHLASSRSFSQSFDLYMQQIFKMLSEQAIGLRTKAVKALTMIVSVDSNILAREDVQASVHGRLLDPSTNVREAAVDLIGQFILKCPDLIRQYYDMIIARILDTGISVRKRVIKILRDICIEHSDFEKIPEICAKIIRRVDDEVGIKKLVTDVFRTMWFQPVADTNRQSNELYQKAVNITKVVSLCKDTGFDWLESLLHNLLDTENQSCKTTTINACQQLIDCLFHRLLKPELKSDTNTVVACLITLYLFCKSYPNLLIPHATTLQPYLSSKVNTTSDGLIMQHVSKILELVVPLMEHPNPKFLAELEEDTMKLMLQQSQNVVQSCASCLASIINNVTHNYKFIVDGFNQFMRFLMYYKREHTKSPDNPALKSKRPTLLRALFTIGLFCRYFDLDSHVLVKDDKPKNTTPTSLQIFDLCMYFTDFLDEEITTKAILAIGFIGIRYPSLLLRDDCKKLYQEILSPTYTATKVKFTVMRSLQNHLMEEENRLQLAEKISGKQKQKAMKKDKLEDTKNIKDFGDALSGATSEIVQVLIKDIMKSFLHAEKQVRVSALQVVAIILRQGLIHPAQCIPYLIAISTDSERLCHVKAEQCLNDLDSRYQGFIHMKAFHGVKMSYQIQTIIQKNNGGYLCGYRETENKIALISHVYGLVRSSKQYRRPFLLSLLKQFDDQDSPPDLLYYITENLAYLNYNTHEEPLFIIHHVDTTVSVTGANVLQNFKEANNVPGLKLLQDNVDDCVVVKELFHPRGSKTKSGKSPRNISDSDDEDEARYVPDVKIDKKALEKIVQQSFGCVLLLQMKLYLKTTYGFTDSKCQKYSPSEPSKLYDKALTRKSEADFTSKYKEMFFSSKMEYEAMIQYYFQFKEMMMSLDTDEGSDSESPDKTNIKSEDQSPSDEAAPAVIKEEQVKPLAEVMEGVIPQQLDSTSLPGLSVNIPVIPAYVYDEVPKQSKRRRSGSRRSSRSSRVSVASDT